MQTELVRTVLAIPVLLSSSFPNSVLRAISTLACKGTLGGKINVRGLQGDGKPFMKAFHTAMDGDDTLKNPALPYFWARKQIERLSDFAVDDSHVKAVTELGLAYNILTEYTSFVTVREMKGEAQFVRQPLPLPQGVFGDTVGGQKPQGPAIATSISRGVSIPSGGSNAVPEPSAALLLLLGTLTVLMQRRR